MFKLVHDACTRTYSRYKGLGIIGTFFAFFQGRATAFAIVFTAAGIILAFKGKLTGDFVALVTAIQGLVFAHSIKEDVRDYWKGIVDKASTGAN